MINYSKFLFSACICSCVLFTVTSCKDTDDFFSKNDDNQTEKEANGFDFSTTREVDLYVKYNGFETLGPVRFGIYDTNPVVAEGTDDEGLSENIKPIIELYTDDKGEFNQTLVLPAYAKTLHIVTGNLAIGFDHSVVNVVNNAAKVTVENDGKTMEVYAARRAPGPGESTWELGKLKSTGYEVNSSGNTTTTQIYKEWGTPLGHWNSATGRPVDYLLDRSSVTTPGLALSDKEVEDMYNKACNILPNNNGIDNSHYRTSADVILKDDSEVTITALGSFTCWNSSLGYYFYNESTKPTSRMDLNTIMLFPNTQDGKRYGSDGNYQNNIGTVRGDAIQLKYYPHINDADPNVKYSDATTIFPKGTRIGFIMRTNGWGMMGSEYCTKKGSTAYNNAMNIWVSSTESMSYAKPFSGKSFKKPNPNGEARTALFAYTNQNDSKYCILSFEDACDDNDYNDLIFALNPANIFLGLNDVEEGKITESGVYAFEDLWPNRGDYDMNDILVDYKHEMTFASSGTVSKEVFRLKTYQNVVGKVSGLALRLNTKVTPSSIVMKKIAPGKTEKDAVTTTFTKDDQENVYFLTADVTNELNTTYIFELTYSSAQKVEKLANVQPFIYRDEEGGKRWEVHIPYEAPTKKMDMSYFGTVDDASIPSEGKWYVRNGVYPFAFYLANATAENFQKTILANKNESKPISDFYPKFIPWVASKGTTNEDWYLHAVEE